MNIETSHGAEEVNSQQLGRIEWRDVQTSSSPFTTTITIFHSIPHSSLLYSLTRPRCCLSPRTPVGLEDVSKYPVLLAAVLQEPGWTDEDVAKLAGGNFLRVMRKAEEVRSVCA
ncbi:Dipeptidase 3 [Portunus trituberculatus]|uniref:Dipeptidase n=1 Tax=Portunus trituberculatus TaxID=210409 RepID=A0A5B7EMY8_PORTR|nr:Dipeptidase 3 [Portunus trituberculatus]